VLRSAKRAATSIYSSSSRKILPGGFD